MIKRNLADGSYTGTVNKVLNSMEPMATSVKSMSEGEKSPPDKLTKYEWGRLVKKPEYWEDRRHLVWTCKECDFADVRSTKQKSVNRYHGLPAKCQDCGKSTRNVLKGAIAWFDRRKDATDCAKALNDARRLR